MKLTSMTDFFLSQESKWKKETEGLYPTLRKYKDVVLTTHNYAKFLKQNLELWMFVPCGLDNAFLQEPTEAHEVIFNDSEYLKEYQEAKERVLFKGVEYVEAKTERSYSIVRICKSLSSINYPHFWKNKVIEDLIPYNLELTPNTLKQLGL